MVARVHLCRPYGGRQGGILSHRPERGLLTTDDQRRATTARLCVNQMTVVSVRGHAHETDLRPGDCRQVINIVKHRPATHLVQAARWGGYRATVLHVVLLEKMKNGNPPPVVPWQIRLRR